MISYQNLRIPQGSCFTQLEVFYMNWTISGVTHLGNYDVTYPTHDSNFIPLAASSFVISLFVLLSLFGLYCAYWTYTNRKSMIVIYAQPFFLYLVICGCIIGLSSLVPMSLDPGILKSDITWSSTGIEDKSIPEMDSACQSQIWLLAIGFALSFPTLFVKTWRVYKIYSVSQKQLRRVVIKIFDCCIAVGVCLLYMIIICSVWQGIDPLHWSITITAYDTYGNPIESYGVCTSNHAFNFIVPVVVMMLLSLIYGNYLCFQCRTIQTINQETKWISLCMVNLLQVSILAIPLLLLERDNPIALFIVKSTTILASYGGTLGLIFIPKMMQPEPEETKNPVTGTFYTRNASSDNEVKGQTFTSEQQLKDVSTSS